MRIPWVGFRPLRERPWIGWVLPLVTGLTVLAWGRLIFTVIGNKPRVWSYGSYAYIPSESYANTQGPAGTGPVPRQIEPEPVLPAAGGKQ